MTPLQLHVLNVENQPEEKKDGCAIADAIYVVVVIHVGFDGIDEARVKFLSLVKDEEGLRATQHHVPDGLSQLALDTAGGSKSHSQNDLHAFTQKQGGQIKRLLFY